MTFAIRYIAVLALLLFVTPQGAHPQSEHVARIASGLKLREVGPALMGGRIADIKVHPSKSSTWYVAVGSGGVWKTTNAGITWTPIFDEQPVYSIGTLELDPNYPDVVFVGTGENVSGRHVAWGNGVYRSRDAGQTWEHVGLDRSEHISRILIDPRNSSTIYVAAEGPLWSAGGDRGVYKSTDGGDTWAPVLNIDENTGVTDIEFDPNNPDVIYAAAYERRRHIWALMAGGPNSGIYKTMDAGETWRRMSRGLPSGDMGKIGIAVTPAAPDIVYATIEADDAERGFYRSTDKGESWEKRNSYISGGTGPHYYQEIEASPTDPDLVYQMDVFLHVTRDGGTTIDFLGTGREKHSDNHALWIDPDDGSHLIAGTDAGLYETFDEGTTWRHFPNLPISQFYKLAVDNASPFFNILGGAQDLGTLHGPSRTMNTEGVRNQDWYVPMGADGYAVAIDPEDQHILYLQTQQGNLYRYDQRSEEALDIQPQPAPGDSPERWNWDSPVILSPHSRTTLYFGSQRLWRSTDRGNSWTAVSGDLTTNRNRYEMPMGGIGRSIDELWDTGAMSKYATITTLSESPVAEGVVYVGTDDGLVQVTEDGGTTWRQAGSLPGLPELSFIQDVKAGQLDGNVVFALGDAHKIGDFTPYLYRSDDRGRSWRSIRGDLPDGNIVWSIEQDHINENVLFLGAEFGLFVSVNGGDNWHKLGGAPPIAFRDLAIQRRDNDVVGATFGRGFYVLDDYSALREAAGGMVAGNTLLPVRDAWWYVPNEPMQARGQPTVGTTSYRAPNPEFGAAFTYYMADTPGTARDARRATERAQRDRGDSRAFPGYDALTAERNERDPILLLLVRDEESNAVRALQGPVSGGLHRVTWNLRSPAPNPVALQQPAFSPPWQQPPQGPLVAPGVYSVEAVLVEATGETPIGTQSFNVVAVPTAPGGTDFVAVARFQAEAAELMRRVTAAGGEINDTRTRLRHMRAALGQAPVATPLLHRRMNEFEVALNALAAVLNGDPVRGSLNESTVPGIRGRVGRVTGGHWRTRQMPTATQRRNIEIAQQDFTAFRADLNALLDTTLGQLERALERAGAPWTPGRRIN